MEELFESRIKVTIHNKTYNFTFPDLSEVNGRIIFVNNVKKELREYFFKGYEDNRAGKSKPNSFTSRVSEADLFMKRKLSSMLKEIYEAGYKKYDLDKEQEYKIPDLDIDDPKLESNIKILASQSFSDGMNDAKNSSYKKTKINISDDLFFIKDKLNDILIKAYNDGYEEGINFINQKYKIDIPKISNSYIQEKIKIEIDSAFATGKKDFDDNKPENLNYEPNLNFIKDSVLKNQVLDTVKKAYADGYQDYLNKAEKKLLEKQKENEIRTKEEKELFYLIKKYGKILQNKFVSALYQYVIKSNELKDLGDYNFINIKSEDQNLLNQVKKIVTSAFTKGKEDAMNGRRKRFPIFSMPYKIKDDLIQNEVVNLVNKAYDDGYNLVMDEIHKNLTSEINKNPEIKRLEELLEKFKKYKPIKKISNLPDRYVNQMIYSVEVPSES